MTNNMELSVVAFELSAQVSEERLILIGDYFPKEIGTRLAYSIRDEDTKITIAFCHFNDDLIDSPEKKNAKSEQILSYFSQEERCGHMAWMTQDRALIMALDILAKRME